MPVKYKLPIHISTVFSRIFQDQKHEIPEFSRAHVRHFQWPSRRSCTYTTFACSL